MQDFIFSSPYITAASILLVLSLSGLTVISAKYYLHMLQLEGYFLSQYAHHLFARIRKPALLFHPQAAKKPLKFTPRIVRLYICLALVALVFSSLCVFYLPAPLFLLCLLLLPLTSVLVLFCAVLCLPIEKTIAAFYIRDAKKKLAARRDLTIIGITGSYGKTSTKFILSTILSEKFSVLTPPSSYNTTMGVVRVIRERLQPDDEIFICEMGSRHIGDIREICSFVHPHAAILTSIGPQHLDTFGSLEGVKKAKFELIEALGKEGTAVFSSSGEEILSLFEKAPCKKRRAGFLPEDDVSAQNISVGCSGSAFTLTTSAGQSVECFTRLLGAHNIANITAAAAMALELGMTLEEIARGISKIQPVEHRLEIVSSAPVTIIDDAFNSSPNGAKAALDVLGRFTGRRIIVTPGFVELGAKEDQYHLELGRAIAKNADAAILVGKKRTEKIKEGLGDFAGTVYTVSSLKEATEILGQISIAGDVVLFENDLPDNYNE